MSSYDDFANALFAYQLAEGLSERRRHKNLIKRRKYLLAKVEGGRKECASILQRLDELSPIDDSEEISKIMVRLHEMENDLRKINEELDILNDLLYY